MDSKFLTGFTYRRKKNGASSENAEDVVLQTQKNFIDQFLKSSQQKLAVSNSSFEKSTPIKQRKKTEFDSNNLILAQGDLVLNPDSVSKLKSSVQKLQIENRIMQKNLKNLQNFNKGKAFLEAPILYGSTGAQKKTSSVTRKFMDQNNGNLTSKSMQKHNSQSKIKHNHVILPEIQSRNQIKCQVTSNDYSGIEAYSQTIDNESKKNTAQSKRASNCKSSMQHQRGANILSSYHNTSTNSNKPFKTKHSRSSTSQGVYHQTSPKNRKRSETHHHHHYHIDLNIHQVNNILVNYGILPRTIHQTQPQPQPQQPQPTTAYRNASAAPEVKTPQKSPKGKNQGTIIINKNMIKFQNSSMQSFNEEHNQINKTRNDKIAKFQTCSGKEDNLMISNTENASVRVSKQNINNNNIKIQSPIKKDYKPSSTQQRFTAMSGKRPNLKIPVRQQTISQPDSAGMPPLQKLNKSEYAKESQPKMYNRISQTFQNLQVQTDDIIRQQEQQVKNFNKKLFLDNFEKSQQTSLADLTSSAIATKKLEKSCISDFKILDLVGTGNFGKVHKALNTKHNRECALKILQKESVLQMKQVDHIISEREILKYLSNIDESEKCPFIIDIYSSFQDQENLYFELEYVQGCSLLSQIRQKNGQVQNNMAFYASEVILSLEYLHKNHIIYRDLKPENIVLSMYHGGHIKLVDFGFAKQLKGQKTLTNCGTPVYIAPEILRCSGHSYQVDVWSLGVLMVEIVSGQTPFQADNTKMIYEKISQCQPIYNRYVTPCLRELLDKIFVPDPSMRITLNQIKKHRVFQDIDWSTSMRSRFECEAAPFIPLEATFFERAQRDSEPKKNLMAIMKEPESNEVKRLSFDQTHFEKFLREEQVDDSATTTAKRKRQNPLGDFKFKRINEYF